MTWELTQLRTEVTGLRTQLEAERQKYADHMHRCAAFVCDIMPRALKAEGQVAAIRALCDEPRDEREGPGYDWLIPKGYNEALAAVRAALVASSPTTPEAKK